MIFKIFITFMAIIFLTNCSSLNVQSKKSLSDLDARKIASTDDLKSDYAEAYADPNLEEVPRIAKELQNFILSLGELVDESKQNVAIESKTESNSHCNDLWLQTCSKKNGSDPTGVVFGSHGVDFDTLVPGFHEILQPKLLDAIEYIYENDSFYRRELNQKFRVRRHEASSALSCIATYMVHRVFTEFSTFPLKCFDGNISLLRDIMYNDNSLYIENLVRRAVRHKFPDTSVVKNVENIIFPRVKEIIRERIAAMAIDPSLKVDILNRLTAIQFRARDCAHFGTDNASYNTSNTFTLCWGNLLRNSSIFARVHIIAHELTHSFDPCVLSIVSDAFQYSDKGDIDKIQDEYPFGPTVKCLSRRESVGAKFLTSPRDICQSQFGEAFSDIIAAEVVPIYIEKFESARVSNSDHFKSGIENVWRSNCSSQHVQTRDEQNVVHPRTEDRVNFILRVNSKVRRAMSCEPVSVNATCELRSNLDSAK